MDQGKKEIEAILSTDEKLSYDEIMLCAEQIKKDGNIFFIGLEKIRSLDTEQYLVEIKFPNNTEKGDIIASSNILREACLSVIKQYFHT